MTIGSVILFSCGWCVFTDQTQVFYDGKNQHKLWRGPAGESFTFTSYLQLWSGDAIFFVHNFWSVDSDWLLKLRPLWIQNWSKGICCTKWVRGGDRLKIVNIKLTFFTYQRYIVSGDMNFYMLNWHYVSFR